MSDRPMTDAAFVENLRTVLNGTLMALENDRAAVRLIRNGKWALRITASGVHLAQLMSLDDVDAATDILNAELDDFGNTI